MADLHAALLPALAVADPDPDPRGAALGLRAPAVRVAAARRAGAGAVPPHGSAVCPRAAARPRRATAPGAHLQRARERRRRAARGAPRRRPDADPPPGGRRAVGRLVAGGPRRLRVAGQRPVRRRQPLPDRRGVHPAVADRGRAAGAGPDQQGRLAPVRPLPRPAPGRDHPRLQRAPRLPARGVQARRARARRAAAPLDVAARGAGLRRRERGHARPGAARRRRGRRRLRLPGDHRGRHQPARPQHVAGGDLPRLPGRVRRGRLGLRLHVPRAARAALAVDAPRSDLRGSLVQGPHVPGARDTDVGSLAGARGAGAPTGAGGAVGAGARAGPGAFPFRLDGSTT